MLWLLLCVTSMDSRNKQPRDLIEAVVECAEQE